MKSNESNANAFVYFLVAKVNHRLLRVPFYQRVRGSVQCHVVFCYEPSQQVWTRIIAKGVGSGQPGRAANMGNP